MKACLSEWYNDAYLEGRVVDGIDTRSAHGGDSTSGSNDVSTHFPVFFLGRISLYVWFVGRIRSGMPCRRKERYSKRDHDGMTTPLCRDISTWQVIPNERAKVEG